MLTRADLSEVRKEIDRLIALGASLTEGEGKGRRLIRALMTE